MVDVGEHPQGGIARGAVTLRNDHAGPVVVEQLSKSCSCTTADVSRPEVPAGGTAELTVEWKLGARRGTAAERTTLLYRTPDGDYDTCVVEFRATVAPDIAYQPAGLTFLTGQPGVGVIRFSPGRQATFRLTKAATDHPSLTAVLAPSGDAVTVTFTPPADDTWASDQSLSVQCDIPNEPIMRIPVRVRRPDGPSE